MRSVTLYRPPGHQPTDESTRFHSPLLTNYLNVKCGSDTHQSTYDTYERELYEMVPWKGRRGEGGMAARINRV